MTVPCGKSDDYYPTPKEGTGESSCSLCGAATESRYGVRIPYQTQVQFETGFGPIYGTTRNISSGGMFVETKSPLAIGQKVELKFKFRSGTHSIKLMARVVRETSDGSGLRLL